MRLSELYTSVQGEGPNAGHLTQFIRFAGCNLRCAGWPCDTQHAVDPKLYRHEWQTVTPDQILEQLDKSIPRVVFTGGEPFLQSLDELRSLAKSLIVSGYTIEVFTNGTLPWPAWVSHEAFTLIMDWKLPGSHEDAEDESRFENLHALRPNDAIKFVCVDEHDFHIAEDLYWEYARSTGAHVYVGAAWGKITEAEIVELMKKSDVPFKLNVQIHNYIFNRNDRGI